MKTKGQITSDGVGATGLDGWVAEALGRYQVPLAAANGVDHSPTADSTDRPRRKYDLEERTTRFGEAVIDLARRVKPGDVNSPLISQVVRAATSVGANYLEADATLTKKDFQHRIALCAREAKEAKHWLRMLARANHDRSDTCRDLWREANELALIFSAIRCSVAERIPKR